MLVPSSKVVRSGEGKDCQFVEDSVSGNLDAAGSKLPGCFDSYTNDRIAKILNRSYGRRSGAVTGADCSLGSVQINQVLFDKALLSFGQIS